MMILHGGWGEEQGTAQSLGELVHDYKDPRFNIMDGGHDVLRNDKRGNGLSLNLGRGPLQPPEVQILGSGIPCIMFDPDLLPQKLSLCNHTSFLPQENVQFGSPPSALAPTALVWQEVPLPSANSCPESLPACLQPKASYEHP